MAINIDKALGIHPEALRVRSRRGELLASNVANADTPAYQARDVDFRKALQSAQEEQLSLAKTSEKHISPPGENLPGGAALYRIPEQPSLDGNTVDMHREKVAFAENAVQYQASLNFLGAHIKSLIGAFRGE